MQQKTGLWSYSLGAGPRRLYDAHDATPLTAHMAGWPCGVRTRTGRARERRSALRPTSAAGPGRVPETASSSESPAVRPDPGGPARPAQPDSDAAP